MYIGLLFYDFILTYILTSHILVALIILNSNFYLQAQCCHMAGTVGFCMVFVNHAGNQEMIVEKMVVDIRFTSMHFSSLLEINSSSPGFLGCSQKPLNSYLVSFVCLFCILFVFYGCLSQKIWFHTSYSIVDMGGRSLLFLTDQRA